MMFRRFITMEDRVTCMAKRKFGLLASWNMIFRLVVL